MNLSQKRRKTRNRLPRQTKNPKKLHRSSQLKIKANKAKSRKINRKISKSSRNSRRKAARRIKSNWILICVIFQLLTVTSAS